MKKWFLFLFGVVMIGLCVSLTGCQSWFLSDTERLAVLTENIVKLQKEAAEKQAKIGLLNSTSQKIMQSQSAIEKQNAELQEKIKEQAKQQEVADQIKKYENWVYLLVLCFVSIVGSWYFKKTGKESETLGKISESLNNSLSFKQKAVYRVLRWLYRRYVVKKNKEKNIK